MHPSIQFKRGGEMEVYTLTSCPSSSHVLTFLLALLFFISSTKPTSATSTTTETNQNFIKTACNSTTYPQLCYNSLSSYASKIKTNPQKLADTALTVTLEAARNTSSIVSNLSKQKGLKPAEAAIIKDCIENIGDSIDELKQSLQAVEDLGGSNVKFQIANIQTWVSAALTDENTCTDGFDGRTVSLAVKNKISSSISRVTKLTSNALAIINNLSY